MRVPEPRTRREIRISRALLFIAGLVLLLGAAFFAWFKLDPISFRRLAFEPLRDGLFFYRELQPVSGWRKLQAAPDFRSRRVEIPVGRPGDLTLVADLWEPENGPGPHPALLILHGSTLRGRRHGLVRMLAHEFQQLGWVVLTPDARGFGESEDPQVVQDPENWRNTEDIGRCVGFLYDLGKADKQRLFVLGHSMGGAGALEGALDDSRVAALILIGPPRYLSSKKASRWERVRFSVVRNLPEVISENVMKDRRDAGDIALFARQGRLRQTPKPILLLDGALESEAEQRFLKEVSRELSNNSAYHTVPGVGHYCGVYQLPGTDLIVWRRDLLEACTAPTLAFIERAVDSDSRPH